MKNNIKYTDNFIYSLEKLLGIEGGFSNNKFDKGGKTNFGITQKLANKYNIKVENLTSNDVKKIYYKEFWEPNKLNNLKSKKLAFEIFEFIVNAGHKKMIWKIVQRSYNLIKNELVEDGIPGPKTFNALNKFTEKKQNEKFLIKTINIFQGMWYIAITENNENIIKDLQTHKKQDKLNNKFIKGWILKRT